MKAAMMTQADCLKAYGSQYNINKLIDQRKLFHLERGIYSEKEHVPTLAVLAFKYPKAIVTMNNAFYIHGLTDVIPELYNLATDRDAAKIRDKRVHQYFYPKESFMDGVEMMDHRGFPIRIYTKERMLIELIRYKSKLPFDYYKEIILNYRKIMQRLDIQAIQDHAIAMPKSEMIMEVLQMEVF